MIFKSEKGQTVAEFIIISIIFLPLVLSSFQLALLINAHQAVKFAAYKSARSLVLNINSSTLEETIKAMKNSALLSLIPVSPILRDAKQIAYTSLGKFSLPKDLSSLLMLKAYGPKELFMKYLYANRFCDVSIDSPKDISQISRGSKVRVKVDFLYNMGVPLVGKIFQRIIKYGNPPLLNSAYEGITEHTLFPIDMNSITSGLNLIKISKSVTMQAEN